MSRLAAFTLVASTLAGLCLAARPAGAQPAVSPVSIVAAENFYGDVARQIGGTDVRVTSILSNPEQDPHLFEASPSVAREVSGARIVVYSGIDYDPWMQTLLAAARSADRRVIVVADLAGKKPGDNPHIWYDLAAMQAYASALATALAAADPAHASAYQQRLARFDASLQPINDKIASLHARLSGTPATATEPVFGYMFQALGMAVRNAAFQLAVMNNTEPSAADVAAMEDDLRGRKVRLFIYNSQATDDAAERLLRIARTARVPVLGVTETEPRGAGRYQDWIAGQLDALDRALSAPPP